MTITGPHGAHLPSRDIVGERVHDNGKYIANIGIIPTNVDRKNFVILTKIRTLIIEMMNWNSI